MTDEPLRSWCCDSCGDPIVDTNRALVIWRTDGMKYHDFRIVHKSLDGWDCDPGAGAGYSSNLELSEFLGSDGLARLLSWLSVGPIKNHPGVDRVQDLDQFVDLVRRVQTPWYEEARPRLNDEETHHWLDDANEYYPYLPEVLQRTAEKRLGRR